MPVSRSTRRLFTAAGLVAAGVTLWQTDPAWARDAGLDLWNVGRFHDELGTCAADMDRLTARECRDAQRYAANAAVVNELVGGRRPLAEAAEAMWQMNRADPGYVTVLECRYCGPTPAARSATNLIHRVRCLDLPPADRAAVLARLTAEYARAFGVPPPPGV